MKKILFIIVLFIFFVNEKDAKTEIQNKIIAKVGNDIITNFDIINEINTILALSNEKPTQENINKLQTMAFISLKKNIIKKIEIEKFKITEFNNRDLNNYIVGIESNLGLNDSSLQDHFKKYSANYEHFVSSAIISLKWNSLIYTLYQKQLDVDENLINSSLSKEITKQEEITEYNLSEIVIENNENINISNILSSIETKGFKTTATLLSNSITSSQGGEIGWMPSKSISTLYLKEIKKLNIGEVTSPINNSNNIVLIKLNDKRILKKENLDLDRIKKAIVKKKKEEKLDIFSNSHYIDLEKKTFIELNG